MIRKILTVAWQDFRQTVLRKAFLIAIVGIPLMIITAFAVAALMIMNQEDPPLEGTVGIIDATGEVVAEARVQFDEARIARDRDRQLRRAREQAEELMSGPMAMGPPAAVTPADLARGDVRIDVEQIEPADETGLDELRARILAGTLLAAAVVPAEVLQTPDAEADSDAWPRFDLYVGEDMDSDHTSLIERRIAGAVVRVRALRRNLDPDEAVAMLQPPRSNTRRLLADGQETSEDEDIRELRQLVPMAFMMLLWIATFTAGQHLMMSTIEEKSNRVMEVLLSAVSPFQLMAGKILGQGGVGLLLVLIYSSLAVAGLVTFAFMHLIDPIDLVYLCVYFFMAYFMIASVMAAVGSAVSDIREANTLLTPIMIVLMVPLLLWLPIINAPNGVVATSCSFIPPAIPFAMILRLAADEPVPIWQIPATIVWGYACVVGMVWMATKIFRVGVLMYGKPPTPLQILKWVRYS